MLLPSVQVGTSKLHYSFPQSSPYYFNLVISNTRVPIASVTATFNGVSVALTRTYAPPRPPKRAGHARW